MNKPLMLALAAALLAAGCATAPTGPNVMVLPGTGKTFDEFRVDDMGCRDYAFQQIGGKASEQAGNEKAISNAAVGTAIGAVAGAAIGGRGGAGAGAGMGLIVGSASGAEATQGSMYGSQRRYDHAYVQCMYARGHRVPVNGSYYSTQPAAGAVAPQAAPPAVMPAPPAGSPPPPPPR